MLSLITNRNRAYASSRVETQRTSKQCFGVRFAAAKVIDRKKYVIKSYLNPKIIIFAKEINKPSHEQRDNSLPTRFFNFTSSES